MPVEPQSLGSVKPLIAEGSPSPRAIQVSVGPGDVVWVGDAAFDPAGARTFATLLIQASAVAATMADHAQGDRP